MVCISGCEKEQRFTPPYLHSAGNTPMARTDFVACGIPFMFTCLIV